MNPFAVICLLYINITTGHKLRKNRTFPRRFLRNNNSKKITILEKSKTFSERRLKNSGIRKNITAFYFDVRIAITNHLSDEL